MSKENKLGMGLGALLSGSSEKNTKEDGILFINISQIQPNPKQPRKNFKESELNQLATSIKNQGLIQPIIVRPTNNNQFEIIAGERRWRASQLAGLHEIGCVVRQINDNDILETALIENIQREDLNAIEEAEGYAILNSKHGLSHDEIANSIGKKRVTISNALRLLKLPPEIRKSIRDGKISAGHGRAILQKKTISAMQKFWKKIIDESLSVRAAESHAKPSPKTKKIKKLKIQKGSIKAIENQLVEIFGTKVKLKPAQVGGSIEIVYFSDDDLERIIDLLQSL